MQFYSFHFGKLTFLGGWDGLILNPELIFSIKIGIIVFFFIFIRANVPRYRYDQLMQLGWKIFKYLIMIKITLIYVCVFFFSIKKYVLFIFNIVRKNRD